MTITILKDGPFALGGTDVRTFKEGDVHNLAPHHEKELVDAGHAEDGGNEKEAAPAPAMNARDADHLKVCQAPQAADTAAVAARVVADGVTHASEGDPISNGTNQEGARVAHAQKLVNSAAVEAGDEKKEQDEADAEAKAKAEAEAVEKAEAEAAEKAAAAKADAAKDHKDHKSKGKK